MKSISKCKCGRYGIGGTKCHSCSQTVPEIPEYFAVTYSCDICKKDDCVCKEPESELDKLVDEEAELLFPEECCGEDCGEDCRCNNEEIFKE